MHADTRRTLTALAAATHSGLLTRAQLQTVPVPKSWLLTQLRTGTLQRVEADVFALRAPWGNAAELPWATLALAACFAARTGSPPCLWHSGTHLGARRRPGSAVRPPACTRPGRTRTAQHERGTGAPYKSLDLERRDIDCGAADNDRGENDHRSRVGHGPGLCRADRR